MIFVRFGDELLTVGYILCEDSLDSGMPTAVEIGILLSNHFLNKFLRVRLFNGSEGLLAEPEEPPRLDGSCSSVPRRSTVRCSRSPLTPRKNTAEGRWFFSIQPLLTFFSLSQLIPFSTGRHVGYDVISQRRCMKLSATSERGIGNGREAQAVTRSPIRPKSSVQVKNADKGPGVGYVIVVAVPAATHWCQTRTAPPGNRPTVVRPVTLTPSFAHTRAISPRHPCCRLMNVSQVHKLRTLPSLLSSAFSRCGKDLEFRWKLSGFGQLKPPSRYLIQLFSYVSEA
ncbi:unnamed protein product [Nesidiocoris tenuis]|uniref:Uncharacterized protein n=1 Tax=Nesidiocoris tenuis TaxID=355587 RepID=A0A6H5G0L5_9HEMI|nr:unnamed protein product [Nesidiocoris tenuis]